MNPKYYPIYLNITGRECVVVGGGEVAYRKACGLKDAGGMVVIVSPEFCNQLLNEKGLTLKRKRYETTDVEAAAIVVAATDNGDINRDVYTDAAKRNIPVNVVDHPELCSFIVPSVIRRGDLCISISTGGTSPALARNTRLALEEWIGKEYEDITCLLSIMRQVVIATINDEKRRKAVLKRLAGQEFLEMIRRDGRDKTEAVMRRLVMDESNYADVRC